MKKNYIELAGKKLELKMNLGVIEDYCDDLGLEENWQASITKSPRNMRMFLYHMTKHNGVSADELREVKPNQLIKALAMLNDEDSEGK